MSFNGLFDLPSLFFILTLIAFFVYRNGYKVEYGLSTFALSYWIQMACTIKYIYMMVVKIQVIDNYMTDNFASNVYVKWLRIIFGLQRGSAQGAEGDLYFRKKVVYMISLNLTIYCCQVWRQMKFLDMHEKTKALESGIDSITKVCYYLEKGNEIFTDNEKLE
jgi:hypothetical protein